MHNLHCTRDSTLACREGRASEVCRRATYLVLFTPQGRPRALLFLTMALWGMVAGITVGTPG